MRKYTSRLFNVISIFFIATPVLYPITLWLAFDISGKRLLSLFLSPLFWVTSGLAVASGIGLWVMQRWAWYLFMAANLFMVYLTAFMVSNYGEGHQSALVFLAWTLVLFLFILIVGREVRVPYFLPYIRWWESDPSKKLILPASVETAQGPIGVDILDLSVEGCFIKSPAHFHEGEPVSVTFRIFGHELHCIGNVVWKAESTVTHPRGIGVRFSALDRFQRKKLRIAVHRLSRMQLFTIKTLGLDIEPKKEKFRLKEFKKRRRERARLTKLS